MINITATCINAHAVSWRSLASIYQWSCCRKLSNSSRYSIFNGNSHRHNADLANYLNLQFVQFTQYYKIQNTILFPVVSHRWINTQTAVVKQMKQSRRVDVHVRGKGRCDSSGHSTNMVPISLRMKKTI